MKTTLPTTTATRQFDGFVMAPVKPERLDELKALLGAVSRQTIASMRGKPEADPIVPFERLTTVHYARFVLLLDEGHAKRAVKKSGPMLVLSTNFDGPEGEDACNRKRGLAHHVDELVREAGAGLERIFECCKGYTKGGLRRFLMKNQTQASTFYVGAAGRSRNQILWESGLRREVDRILDRNSRAWSGHAPEEVRKNVLAELKKGPFAEIPTFPAQPDLTGKVSRVQAVTSAILLAILAGACFLAWSVAPMVDAHLALASYFRVASTIGIVLFSLGLPLALLVARFRHLENTDEQFQPAFNEATHQHFKQVSVGENEFLQNQLTHIAYVKPQPLRWFLIRLVFRGLQLLATNTYNKGKLGDIPSIHFARWVLLPNRAVLFFSNFDSSWQSYLGDFIDQASSGLTAVWSNTERYPRTRWLLTSGSRDAARFLAWTREYQLPTQVWYCAYPGVSVPNANTHTEIRRGLADVTSMDAVNWLFHLRSIDRVAVDELHSEERAAEAPLKLDHIQGMILKGFSFKPEARYLMFQVKPDARTAEVRAFLGGLDITSAARGTRARPTTEPLINVAFTYPGLIKIGLDPTLCDAFSTPFVQGSHDSYRALVNGDVGDNAPERWRWGSKDRVPHVMIALFGGDRGTRAIDSWADQYRKEAEEAGLVLLETLEGRTNPDRKEHFGFRDGIAQPTVRGSGSVENAGNTIEPGEILLGHGDNYGNVAHSPQSPSGFSFAHNGSYLVFRQLKQEVEAFWNYCSQNGARPHTEAITAAAKMVGRWPSGASLVRHPDADPKQARFADEDNFSYLSNDADNDRYGARCPFGSHVRRSNPRDWQLGATPQQSLELSNLHRIVRRGRPYGPPLADDMKPEALIGNAGHAGKAGTETGAKEEERGLQFICFNANIDRQFEFIQQVWCNNPKFAGLLSDADPLLGPARAPEELGLDGQTFTDQSDVRQKLDARHVEMQRFVTVVGSSYFFMPSLPAMQLLREDALMAPSPASWLEEVPPDEQLYITALTNTLRDKMKKDYAGKKTLRGAHPKMHGLVQATFTVEADLPDECRAGILIPGRSHRALVRFSNASEEVKPDAGSDIRGVAIKLLDVPGKKLLNGEETSTTQDFLLISHDRFLARTVKEFSEFTAALTRGSVLRYLLGHPAMVPRLLRAVGKHTSPLEIPYWSAVPYLLRTNAVKYKLRPSSPETTPIDRKPADDYLRDRLWERLAQGPVSFDFMVQWRANPESMPIEDATVAWSEVESPFIKVATLTLHQQSLADPAVQAWQARGEDLVFNPWRCLYEHRPLGGMARARRQIYGALSSFRRLRNAATDETDRAPIHTAGVAAPIARGAAASGGE